MRPAEELFALEDLSKVALLDIVCKDTLGDTLPRTDSLDDFEIEEQETCSAFEKSAKVLVFGTTSKGHSIAITVSGQRPAFWIETDGRDVFKILTDVIGHNANLAEITYHNLKRFYGYVPDPENALQAKTFRYARVSFPSWDACFQTKNRIKRKFNGSRTDLQSVLFVNEALKDANAFCNDLGLVMSSWFSVQDTHSYNARSSDPGWSTCQIEIETTHECLKPLDDLDVPPFIGVSFDCEMVSLDGLFVNTTKGDFTSCLCATVWRVDKSESQLHVFVLDDRIRDKNLAKEALKKLNLRGVLHWCASSANLIESFRDFIVQVDADILTGWNIQGFDYPFLFGEQEAQQDPIGKQCTQEIANKAQTAIAKNTRPTTIDLFSRARGMRKSTLDIWKKYKCSSYPKDQMQWPEKVAQEVRRELAELCALSKEEWNFGPNLRDEDYRTLAKNDDDLGKVLADLVSKRPQKDSSKRGLQWGRIRTEASVLEVRQMSSAAKGDNTYKIWSTTGRVSTDLMQIIKDDKKPEENNLRFAAETWLDKDSLKKDLTPKEMCDTYLCGEPDQLAILIDQCARDSEIPMKLIQKLSYVSTWIEMSRVTFTSLSQVLNGGQQRKVFNVIARFVHNEQAINVLPSGWPLEADFDEDEDHDPLAKRKPDQQGATVIEPEPGHQETPVSVLDFESLQPSIIIFFNLCASNLVLEEPSAEALATPGFQIESHSIDHNILVDTKLMTQKQESRVYRFVKHVAGVMPRLLRHLLKSRKAVKALMAAETDAFKKAVLNGRQNGLKIVCNSVYGFCGVSASKGLLPCKPVAAVTTLKGRSFIDAAKNYVEKTYEGSKVLQGDSVTGDTPILVKIKDRIAIVTIEDLSNNMGPWRPWHGTKEESSHVKAFHLDSYLAASESSDVPFEVWSDKGFVRCERVIRHASGKPLWRVVTNCGFVDVTEDHSLLHEDGRLLKVADLKEGTPLLWKSPLKTNQILSSLDHVFFTSSQRPSKVHLYASTKLDCANMIHDMMLWGYTLVDVEEEEAPSDYLGCTEQEQTLSFELSNSNAMRPLVKQIRPIPIMSKMVQDLQTANHHFHVGPGSIVVHNTDSIMIRWHMKPDSAGNPFTIPEAYELGEEASKAITEKLRTGAADLVTLPALADARTAVTLANEKVQCPYLLIKKKNQAGIKWTPSKKPNAKGPQVPGFAQELDMKGIDAVRRDRTKMVRELSEQLLEHLLVENDPKTSLDLLEKRIADILEDRIAVDDFVLSKSLKGSQASENVPHVQAWRRMQERGDPGCPEKGGRMPVLIVDPQGPQLGMALSKVPLQQRCEHPSFVKNSGGTIKICKTYQLEGLQETIERLQTPTRWTSQVKNLFETALEKARQLLSNTRSLLEFKSDGDKEMTSVTVIHTEKEPPKKKKKMNEPIQSMSLFRM